MKSERWLRLLLAVILAAGAGLNCSGDDAPPDAGGDGALPDVRFGDTGGDRSPGSDLPPGAPTVTMPRQSIQPDELALIVNENDPQSVAVAAYYQQQRQIPAANVIKLKLKTGVATLTAAEFKPLKAAVDQAAGAKIQALALTWMLPYRVHCMSITSAFALGYDIKYCNDKAISGKSCDYTAPVAYYAKPTTRPYTDLGLRPAMMLAGVDQQQVLKLIDRGLAAEATFPAGKGWLIRTTDSARSTRYLDFQATVKQHNHPGGIALEYIDNSKGTSAGDVIANKQGVLFYFTGLTKVDQLETNAYRPGAVADHLTSFGGQLKDASAGGQMSVLRWLEAGVTGSYGTVVEPCNFTQKFPDTRILLPYYFMGNTLVEAYWKSVSWPGEGVFVGDPLARPWGTKVSYSAKDSTLTIRTTTLQPAKQYRLLGRKAAGGAFEPLQTGILVSRYELKEIKVTPVKHVAYRLEPQ